MVRKFFEPTGKQITIHCTESQKDFIEESGCIAFIEGICDCDYCESCCYYPSNINFVTESNPWNDCSKYAPPFPDYYEVMLYGGRVVENHPVKWDGKDWVLDIGRIVSGEIASWRWLTT